MLAYQFHTAVAATRTGSELDELARGLWRGHAEGRLADADAQALSEAIKARRAALAAKATPKAAGGLRRGARRREKMFGVGRPRALDRNAKARIMHWARCLSRRTAKGKAYGQITAKALAVLEALLWGFHNAKSGFCFPSYERIAEAAHCAVSTVGETMGRQCKSEGAERRQEASGKTKPRKRTKTRANRPCLCYNANVVRRRKRLHVQIHHFSGPGRRRS